MSRLFCRALLNSGECILPRPVLHCISVGSLHTCMRANLHRCNCSDTSLCSITPEQPRSSRAPEQGAIGHCKSTCTTQSDAKTGQFWHSSCVMDSSEDCKETKGCVAIVCAPRHRNKHAQDHLKRMCHIAVCDHPYVLCNSCCAESSTLQIQICHEHLACAPPCSVLLC